MTRRPPADRTDDIGFTCRECGQLIGRSAERVRQLCVETPGFGERSPDDGTWRIRPPVALAALAISLDLKARGKRGLSAAGYGRRTMGGVQTLRAIGQVVAGDPELQDHIRLALETKLAGWWHRKHAAKPPETEDDPEPVAGLATVPAGGGG